jgi:hypothetical protein
MSGNILERLLEAVLANDDEALVELFDDLEQESIIIPMPDPEYQAAFRGGHLMEQQDGESWPDLLTRHIQMTAMGDSPSAMVH